MKADKKISEAFGKVLKELRAMKDISQQDLAFECSLDRTYISLLERGLRQPSLATMLALSNSLGVSATEMMRRVEAKL